MLPGDGEGSIGIDVPAGNSIRYQLSPPCQSGDLAEPEPDSTSLSHDDPSDANICLDGSFSTR